MLKLNKRVGTFCINTGGTAGFYDYSSRELFKVIPGIFYISEHIYNCKLLETDMEVKYNVQDSSLQRDQRKTHRYVR